MSASADDLLCREDEKSIDLEAEFSCLPICGLTPAEQDELISRFFEWEIHYLPQSDYLDRYRNGSLDINTRQDAISYMLKVTTYYNFGPATTYLSINYFDRFLSSHDLPMGNVCPVHLLTLGCLSLAAKMEEQHVPNLLDLQIGDPKFIFEPRTIQRMELLVMDKLKWRMWSITPFSFIHYFVNKLLESSSFFNISTTSLFSKAVQLILSATGVDFLGYRPSSIAAASVICAAAAERVKDTKYPPEFYSREEIWGCMHQIQEMQAMDSHRCARKIMIAAPVSPVAVLDIAAACTGSNDTHQSPSTGVENSTISSLMLTTAKHRKLHDLFIDNNLKQENNPNETAMMVPHRYERERERDHNLKQENNPNDNSHDGTS